MIKGIKMNTLKLALLAAVGALTMTSVAQAQDAPFAFAFNVGASTDYVFRGISQTDEDPQVFAGVDATFASIGYAGAWISNVDFNNGTDAEFDLYAGFKPTVGAATLDFGVIYYGYINQPSGSNEDYWEFKAAGSVPAGPMTLGAAIYYSPEFFGKTGDATYIEANAAFAVPNTKFSISGALGHQYVEGPFDYTTWNAGVGLAVTDHLGIDLRYFDTDEHKFGKLYDSRIVASIKATF